MRRYLPKPRTGEPLPSRGFWWIPPLFFFVLALLGHAPLVADADGPTVDRQVEMDFEAFAGRWVENCQKEFVGTLDRKQMIQEQDGSIVLRYKSIDQATVATRVKPTRNKKTPYVGVLKYSITTFEARHRTREEAEAGPFLPSSIRKITEIFRYSGGAWRQ